MNKNKVRKWLKKNKLQLRPKLPSIVKMIIPVKFFIQYFTNRISKTGHVVSNELSQIHLMKNLRDKLIFYLNKGHQIKLSEQDICNVLIASYIYRNVLVSRYHDNKSAVSINRTIKCLQRVYMYCAINKRIAKENLNKLKRVYR